MKRTVQKFIGDAIRLTLKSGQSPVGTLEDSKFSDHLTIEPDRIGLLQPPRFA